jgi:hypothetical protein
LFEAIVKGIVFIHSFSICSLLVYRNAICYVDFISCYLAIAIDDV